jgi:dTDP-4-amino-4,6-dideoxygalactose transaminase
MKRHITVFNPSITPWILLKAVFTGNGDEFCRNWFSNHTQKKHVLITSSCRNALWLAYRAYGIHAEVITTPLICYSALESALSAGQYLHFCDLAERSILMDEELITECIGENTGFIQATHQGGQMVNMRKIRSIADHHDLRVIEDCAQAFGSHRDGIQAGLLGDVACFTLSKNCYGLGGGILATNDKDIYLKAKSLQDELPHFSHKLLVFRMVRYLLETYSGNFLADLLFAMMMGHRDKRLKLPGYINGDKIKRTKPSRLFAMLFKVQQPRFEALHQQTSCLANKIIQALDRLGIPSFTSMEQSSYPKFFFSHQSFKSERMIPELVHEGIEAKHLENSYGSPLQPRIEESGISEFSSGLERCRNYAYLYDKIVNLPLHHAMSDEQTDYLTETLHKIIHAKDSH